MSRTKQFKEEEILDKAISLFWDKGFNGASAQDLVDNLGISRSSIYDTFSDKRTLFIKALQQYRKKTGDGLKEVLANSKDAKATIRAIFEQTILETLQASENKGCFMVNTTTELAIHDNEIAKIVNDNRNEIQNFFFEAIQNAQEIGAISKDKDALALSRFIFNSYSGIRVSARSSGMDKATLDDIVKVTLSVLD
ncbi:TetR/AcrR family transcriptional regulator [Flavobacterium sp. WC2509]|uniref:TetR/AcrR family transcriptional regulator n=1 Tax=Flavobacterium sp. WC2509 TaxID=3461406 RepID=UPI00404513BE